MLGRFSPDEKDQLDMVLNATCQVIRVYLHRGIEAASQVANSSSAHAIVAARAGGGGAG